MSLFFNRIAKIYVGRKNSRLLSSETPYLLLRGERVSVSPNGDRIQNHKLFDPKTEETVTFTDKTFPKDLWEGTAVGGSSRGWSAFLNIQNGSFHLSDLFCPWSSKSSPKVITFPRFADLHTFPTRVIRNVSLSSSPDLDDDYVMAVKFSGSSQLSLCRPGSQDSKWTNIETVLNYFNNSDVTYSKTDQMFYMLSKGGQYLGAWDLHGNLTKYQKLRFTNLPKMSLSEWEMLDSCFRIQHLAESPCGERFIVKWYGEIYEGADKKCLLDKTKRFMVFRQDRGSACYTDDIGDLCIFFGKSETFCLKASMYPGLVTNSIYYAGYGVGVYHIATGLAHPYSIPNIPNRELCAPYWIPPRF